MTPLDTIAEGDRVVTLSTWAGTHHGKFTGIPSTGRRVTAEAWTIDRYRDGQLAESRIIMDAGMLGQLGVLPGPRAAELVLARAARPAPRVVIGPTGSGPAR